jgi:LPXTG-site transpeptidase (sortase) family protein
MGISMNSHKAFYDENGDIILPPRPDGKKRERKEQSQPLPKPKSTHEPLQDGLEEIVQWIVVEDTPQELHQPERIPDPPGTSEAPPDGYAWNLEVRRSIANLRAVTRQTMREGAQQYSVSIRSSGSIIARILDDIDRAAKAVWRFLAQPVWVPARKKQVKQYSRGTLFAMDILRFGGTFAFIFLTLFVALNYDSFWQIARSDVVTLLESPSVDTPGAEHDDHVIDTLKTAAALDAESKQKGDLISYLPTVGPPDNRILIPKLKLNVPMVSPKIDALLKQDWAQVELDIQDALQLGVVHYPGTANPGQAGNFFVTGHSSYYPWAPGAYKTVFARLAQLEVGDEYWVYYKGDKHRYVVQSKKEVSPGDITVLDQPEGKRLATLMTCTPVGTTLRRLIVQSEEVDPVTGKTLKVGERSEAGVKPLPSLEALPI